MQESGSKLAFLERRLTLLERKVVALQTRNDEASTDHPSDTGHPLLLGFNDPGILIARMYPPERDSDGQEFCWIGSEGPVQIVLPVAPVQSLKCSLILKPHPEVDFSTLRLLVNDEEAKTRPESRAPGSLTISFLAPASPMPSLNILLLGVSSVRPSAFGENEDNRLLAARFYGAEVAYV